MKIADASLTLDSSSACRALCNKPTPSACKPRHHWVLSLAQPFSRGQMQNLTGELMIRPKQAATWRRQLSGPAAFDALFNEES